MFNIENITNFFLFFPNNDFINGEFYGEFRKIQFWKIDSENVGAFLEKIDFFFVQL